MRTSKATSAGSTWAIKRYAYPCKDIRHVYNIWDGQQWLGVVAFCGTETKRFDKWDGQIFEAVVAVSSGENEAIRESVEALRMEAPYADAVISKKDLGGFVYIGKHGSGKGAFIIGDERLHRKTVKSRGWRDSILWIREHVASQATQYDMEAKDLYMLPVSDEMKQRVKALEVRT